MSIEPLPQPLANQMIKRLAELEELKREVDTELVAVTNGLRMAGLIGRRGRAMKAPTHTEAQAREAHAAHGRGERSDWIDAGERQYQREKKRETTQRRRLGGTA